MTVRDGLERQGRGTRCRVSYHKKRRASDKARKGIVVMILFSFSSYKHIARELHTIPLLRVGQFAIARYDN